MILVDPMGHMVSTKSADELHTFAEKLGIKRESCQMLGISKKDNRIVDIGTHYSITKRRIIHRAVKMGAFLEEPREIMRRAWYAKKENRG